MIHGANARGKTTVLEAINLFITGRSFRSSQTSDLIKLGASAFYIEATFVKHQIEQVLKIHCEGTGKRIFYNRTLCPSAASLLGILPGVAVIPDDAALVKGSPVLRRHYLDLQMAQTDPLYVHHLTRYHRAMRQRNALLRTKSIATLGSWEYEMANSAAYLVQQRIRAVKELEKSGQELYCKLSGEEELLSLEYKINTQDQELSELRAFYLAQYDKHRRREMDLGCTLAGPHKDDFIISIGQKEVRFFASEGQQRSCVAALRCAEWARLNRLGDEAPLMLIDDFGVSLDSTRRERLLNHVEGLGQVFLTATHELPIPGGPHNSCILVQ